MTHTRICVFFLFSFFPRSSSFTSDSSRMRPRFQAHCQSRAHSARPSQPARHLFCRKTT
jgi:hypothetical protein